MAKERELLERWLDDTIFEPEELDSLMEETRKLLAQPETEQEPVAWRWKKTSGWAYQDNNNNGGEPLYLASQKRERLTDKEIMVMVMKVSIEMGYTDISPSDLEKSGCFKIIRAAEEYYGIGLDD
jgi:hypothetical protein